MLLYEREAEQALVGLFIGDNFARSSKRSGAWMSVFRSQSGHNGGTLPIVINNNNFAKASPTLLSFDEVRTLFHEFGHGLHGLLSSVRYERLAGTRVLRDFVELPSQLFENWALEPEVLQRHARHYQSGEALPAEWLERLRQARQFDQAWATIQYTGPALIDMALHTLPNGTPVDLAAFEAEQCRVLGIPPDIGQRHYLAHFQHLFAGASYAAGYYVYMWAEVLEADALPHSRRQATRLMPPPPSDCCTPFTAPATPWIRPRPIGHFAGATRRCTPCCANAACCTTPPNCRSPPSFECIWPLARVKWSDIAI
jgi:peptidyl-dipeptidase Dcp